MKFAASLLNRSSIATRLASWFLLIALVVYFLIVLPVNRLMDRFRPEPKPAPAPDSPGDPKNPNWR